MTLNWQHWFANPGLLWLLAGLPVLWFFSLRARRLRRRGLVLLGGGATLEAMRTRRPELRMLRRWLLFFALVLLILGIAGPQWGRDWSQSLSQGRDLVVVLDLSRSMLAEKPSRLERARQALLHLTDALRVRGGHRLGLVVFAGNAKLLCPLTHDYDHFREMVLTLDGEDLDPALLPAEASPSGTRIGQALLLAVEALPTEADSRVQDLLLISDGDDPAGDEEWRVGALAVRARGVPVHVLGVGDPKNASPIPAGEEMLLHQGKPVTTRMQEATLRELATLGSAEFLLTTSGTFPLGEWFEERIASGAFQEQAEDRLPVYHRRYAWFFAPAFVMFSLTMLIGDGVRRPHRRVA